jgi:hypothetical protein
MGFDRRFAIEALVDSITSDFAYQEYDWIRHGCGTIDRFLKLAGLTHLLIEDLFRDFGLCIVVIAHQ